MSDSYSSSEMDRIQEEIRNAEERGDTQTAHNLLATQ